MHGSSEATEANSGGLQGSLLALPPFPDGECIGDSPVLPIGVAASIPLLSKKFHWFGRLSGTVEARGSFHLGHLLELLSFPHKLEL